MGSKDWHRREVLNGPGIVLSTFLLFMVQNNNLRQK
jgi:hypothetical protein